MGFLTFASFAKAKRRGVHVNVICFCEDAEGCLRFVREFPRSMFGLEPSGCDSERCVRLNRGRFYGLSIGKLAFLSARETFRFSGFLIWTLRNTRRRVTSECVIHTGDV